MAEDIYIAVEVAYGLPDKQFLLSCEVEQSLSIRQVIEQSGILNSCPEIDFDKLKFGIFSRLVKDIDEPSVLKSGDRVEIYRPLLIDPKEVRKQRALKAELASS